MALRYCCDWCDRQLPVTITCEGENKKIAAELRWPREINVREYFPHLCESCARKIDIVVGLERDYRARVADITSSFAELNEARRERLGTKG